MATQHCNYIVLQCITRIGHCHFVLEVHDSHGQLALSQYCQKSTIGSIIEHVDLQRLCLFPETFVIPWVSPRSCDGTMPFNVILCLQLKETCKSHVTARKLSLYFFTP